MLGGGDKTAMLKDRRIRIITVSEIRYEGNLYQVNSNDKTIALKDVIAFGTEDRPAAQVIPPSQTVYEVIIFRASHIKHLEVLSQEEQARATVQAQPGGAPGLAAPAPEPAKTAAQFMPAPYMPVPTALSQEAKPTQAEKPAGTDEKKRGPATNRRRDDSEEEPEYVPKNQSDDATEERGYQNHKRADRDQDRGYNNSSGYGGKRGGYQKDRERYIPKDDGGKGVTLGERDNQGSRKDKGPKDFDFDEMVEKNNLLEKEKVVKDKETDQKEPSSAYNPNNFFDNLSTSIGDKPEANGKDPYHLYKTNNETFGFQKKKFNPQGGRGGRGGRGNYGGRGGRDGYRDNRDRDDDGYQQVGSHRGGSYRGDRGDRNYDRDRRDRSPGQGDYRPRYNNDEGYTRGGGGGRGGRGRTTRGGGLPDGF